MKRIWLILPLLSFVLSVIGIWHGLPIHVVGDEEALIGGALKMIVLKTLIPSVHPADFASLYYPPLISYLILIAMIPVVLVKFVMLGFSTSGLQDYFVLNQNAIWISARMLSALFDAGTVAVLFQIVRRLFNERTAWFASLFLITSFSHVLLSHWVRHWTFTTFFVYATILSFLVIPDLIRNPNNQNKQQKIFNPFSFFFSFLDSRFHGNDSGKRGNDKAGGENNGGESDSNQLPNYQITKLLLPGLLGGLGFGVSYIGSLGFFVGLIYLWSRRQAVKNFWKIVWCNTAAFLALCVLFALLNIQEVYRMVSPVDGSLSTPKSLGGLMNLFLAIAQIGYRQEIVIALLAITTLIVVRRYWKTQLFIVGSVIGYATLIYGAFHLELRYVYLMIPALCLLSGLLLNRIFELIKSRWLRVAIVCLVFVWPLISIVRYEQLLLKADTREQAIDWIRMNIKPEESFILSSETMILPRSNEAIVKDQTMGRVRAVERQKIKEQGTPEDPVKAGSTGHAWNKEQDYFYYNMHFWREDLAQEMVDAFIKKEQPKYFIVDYWSEDKLTDRERSFMMRGILTKQFRQSKDLENFDINGNFFAFNDVLFNLKRLGPIVEVYEMMY